MGTAPWILANIAKLQNPFTVTLQPGQDMAMEAFKMLTGILKSNNTEESDETPPDPGMSIRDEPTLIGTPYSIEKV